MEEFEVTCRVEPTKSPNWFRGVPVGDNPGIGSVQIAASKLRNGEVPETVTVVVRP